MKSFDYARTFQRWGAAVDLVWAADVLAVSWGDLGLTNPEQLAEVREHLIALRNFVDYCQRCSDDMIARTGTLSPHWRDWGTIPFRGEVNGDSLLAAYHCPRGHGVWTCGWSVSGNVERTPALPAAAEST